MRLELLLHVRLLSFQMKVEKDPKHNAGLSADSKRLEIGLVLLPLPQVRDIIESLPDPGPGRRKVEHSRVEVIDDVRHGASLELLALLRVVNAIAEFFEVEDQSGIVTGLELFHKQGAERLLKFVDGPNASLPAHEILDEH